VQSCLVGYAGILQAQVPPLSAVFVRLAGVASAIDPAADTRAIATSRGSSPFFAIHPVYTAYVRLKMVSFCDLSEPRARATKPTLPCVLFQEADAGSAMNDQRRKARLGEKLALSVTEVESVNLKRNGTIKTLEGRPLVPCPPGYIVFL
jgi:hypothetical protein